MRAGVATLIDALGWLSSLVLLVTISTQVLKQWRDRTSKGVSTWLFVGEIAASIGFVIYSAFLSNMVFVVTNGAMLVAAVAGLVITIANRRRSEPRR